MPITLSNLILFSMNKIKEKLNDFKEWPEKKKGIALIMIAIFVFGSSLLFATNNWYQRESILSNIGRVDIEIFKIDTARHNHYLIVIPLKFVGLISFAILSYGSFLVWSSRTKE